MTDLEALVTLVAVGLVFGFCYGLTQALVGALLSLGIKRQSHA